MKKRWIIGLVMCLLLVSCGKEKDENPPQTSAAEDATSGVVSWLLPDTVAGFGIKSHENALNNQLKKDGYNFKVRFDMIPEDEEYKEKAAMSDVDIAYVGVDNLIGGTNAKEIVASGAYAPIDEYLTGSELERVIPSQFWDAVRMNGHIYCIPNMTLQKRGVEVVFNLNKIDKSVAESYSGDIKELEKLLPDGEKLLCRTGVDEFMLHYGYQFDNYLIGDAEGNMVNPFKDSHFLEWNSIFDRLYQEGRLTSSMEDDFVIGVVIFDPMFASMEDYYVVPISAVPVPAEYYTASTGIRASSKHKKDAFTLLQLVQTSPDYANLLLYGSTDVASIKADGSITLRLALGVSDFAVPMDPPSLGYFATPEERLEHYSNAKVQVHFTGYDEETLNQYLSLASEYLGAIYPTADEFHRMEYSSNAEYEERIANLRESLSDTYEKLMK